MNSRDFGPRPKWVTESEVIWRTDDESRIVYQKGEKKHRLVLERLADDADGGKAWVNVMDIDGDSVIAKTILQMKREIKYWEGPQWGW